MIFVLARGRVLLERRPSRGIWAGCGRRPEFPDEKSAQAWLAAGFRNGVQQPARLPRWCATLSRISTSTSALGHRSGREG
jgi:hypothetical protein